MKVRKLIFKKSKAPFKDLGIIIPLFFTGFILAACVQTTPFQIADHLPIHKKPMKILLMPSDVLLFELYAGGLEEPKAEWTQSAREHVFEAFKDYFQETGNKMVIYRPPPPDSTKERAQHQLLKLHEAVARAILIHKYTEIFRLPTKKDVFEWSLGEGIKQLRETQNADYALFTYFRDTYTSEGRATIMIIGALFGLIVPGGYQAGIASLVDLHSGNIIWFNRLFRRSGDLRTRESVEETLTLLLEGIPL